MAEEVNETSVALAALSLVQTLIIKLIDSELITRDAVNEIFEDAITHQEKNETESNQKAAYLLQQIWESI